MTPAKPRQDYIYGDNNLIAAKAQRYNIHIKSTRTADGYTEDWRDEVLIMFMQRAITAWGEQSELLNVYAFSSTMFEQAVINDVKYDAVFLTTAIVLITVYSYFVLGSCSPMHFRALSAMIGLTCVLLATTSGYALAFAAGFKFSRMHPVLPFMIMGIGVDDMYVIVNTIDQTPMHLSANERFKIGLTLAGPSITITSVTDGIAFFLGSFTPLPGLQSFCMFCGFTVFMLYFSFLTIFAPLYLEALRRLHRKKSDCCGICCCKEDSLVCCYGLLLTNRQRRFSGLDSDKSTEVEVKKLRELKVMNEESVEFNSIHGILESEASFFDSEVNLPKPLSKSEAKDELYASGIEKFIATSLAPELLTL